MQKVYVQYFLNREAVILPQIYYSLSKPLCQEQQKAVNEREYILKKKGLPTSKELEIFPRENLQKELSLKVQKEKTPEVKRTSQTKEIN